MSAPASLAELLALDIASAKSPALIAALMSTAVNLSTTPITSSAFNFQPFKVEIKYFVASADSIIPRVLNIMEPLVSSAASFPS